MKRRICTILLSMILLLSLAAPCFAAEAKSENAVSAARNGVVRVLGLDKENGHVSSGTGFGVGKAGEETEYFITNWHVIADDDGAVGTMEYYIILDDGAVELAQYCAFPAIENGDGTWCDPIFAKTIVNIDESKLIRCELVYSADTYPDVAILQAERKVPGRVALPLRSSRDLQVSEDVYSLGFPAVADTASQVYEDMTWEQCLALKEGDVVATWQYYGAVEGVHTEHGVVSKLDDFELFGGTYCIEHGAHINNGNSGGPLVDKDGNVVGINTYGITLDEFLNYSVYIDYAMEYLNDHDIAYDYVGMEDPFPVVPVVIGSAVVLVLILVLVVVLVKKPKRAQSQDTGLRIQYESGAVMDKKRFVIKGTVRFGRTKDCNVRYPYGAPGISGRHCEIVEINGQVCIRDLNSTYGTFVNGVRIAANQPVILEEGCVVSLGSRRESFQIVRTTKS